jgi:hypothetical protein
MGGGSILFDNIQSLSSSSSANIVSKLGKGKTASPRNAPTFQIPNEKRSEYYREILQQAANELEEYITKLNTESSFIISQEVLPNLLTDFAQVLDEQVIHFLDRDLKKYREINNIDVQIYSKEDAKQMKGRFSETIVRATSYPGEKITIENSRFNSDLCAQKSSGPCC